MKLKPINRYGVVAVLYFDRNKNLLLPVMYGRTLKKSASYAVMYKMRERA